MSKLSALLAASLTLAAPAAADTYVASWNIEHLGWDNGKDMGSVARVASSFDLIAVQELMDPAALLKLEEELEAQTGSGWSSLASDSVGRGSYMESYGFIWRDDAASWVDGAVVYTDTNDIFAREPFSARFRTSAGFEFVYATVHVIYGDDVEERQREVAALDGYLDWLRAEFPGSPVILSGDFNLPPDDSAWSLLGGDMAPMIRDGATTLSERDGRFANLYDNIWVPSGVDLPILQGAILEFPKDVLSISHKEARASVSDHAPVWIRISDAGDIRRFKAHANAPAYAVEEVIADQSSNPPVIGNRNSGIYHLPNCPGYVKVSPSNQVAFSSPEEAIAAGFRAAKNCS